MSTTTLVVHLDRAALDRLLHDGSAEVEVHDTEQPGQMPVGTMLVTADLDHQPHPDPDAWKQGSWEVTYADADWLSDLDSYMHDRPGIRLAVDDEGHVRIQRWGGEWRDLGGPDRETAWCPEDYCREVTGRRTVGHREDPYEAVRLDCLHEVVDLGDGPVII